MVKGTSRQVIVVQGPEEKLFEQAIFILKADAVGDGVTDEDLMKEARGAIRGTEVQSRGGKLCLQGAVWAAGGAFATGVVWLMTVLL